MSAPRTLADLSTTLRVRRTSMPGSTLRTGSGLDRSAAVSTAALLSSPDPVRKVEPGMDVRRTRSVVDRSASVLGADIRVGHLRRSIKAGGRPPSVFVDYYGKSVLASRARG